VLGGQFAFRSPRGGFIRVQPCHGKEKILPAARQRLGDRATRQLFRLVLNIDSDLPAGVPAPRAAGLSRNDVLADVQKHFDSAASLTPNDEISLDGGTTLVSLIRWEAPDPPANGLPTQQSLERLLCAAIIAAYPARATAVHNWLLSVSVPLSGALKEYSWSYMAGWYAEHGCDNFFRQVWQDAAITTELRNRLSHTNAWAVVSSLAS
jgi:hypothetical protein